MGSNEVFSYVAKQTMTSGNKGASNRVAGIGLPCEYKMIRAARRNWLTVVALSGFGPLSRKVLTATAGLNYGHLIVEGDSRHLPVQKFQIWWLIGVDVVANWCRCGGSLVKMCVGSLVKMCGGSLLGM